VKRSYWDPGLSHASVPRSDTEAFDALRELLFEAVSCRLLGKKVPVALLSGGLDSSSLVAIAARCAQKENRNILALSAVLPESSRQHFSDEREFIEEFRSEPNVTIQYVAPEAGGPFDRIEDPTRFFDAPFHYSRQYLTDAMREAARGAGADVILAGFGGEAGPTTYGHYYLLELAASLRWQTLAREMRRLRVRSKTSPIRALGSEILDLLSPGRRFEPPVLVAPDFMLPLREKRRRDLWWPDHRSQQATAIRDRMAIRTSQHGPPVEWAPVALPFFDKRILEFCLAMPGHMKVRDGYRRYAARRALDGILPPKIQWRTTKGPFAPDYPGRYRVQLGKARDFVAAIRRKDPVRSIVDVDRLSHLLAHPEAPFARSSALTVVPATIYLICFLRQFPEFQP
jgi:asparagine synthase (glutamine-hydrolysing)